MGELQYKNVINRITMIVAEDSQKKKKSVGTSFLRLKNVQHDTKINII